MLKRSMIADYLRSYAHWRLDRAEEPDEGRNARSAVALLDAAAYTQQLDDSARVLVRMADAGCFGTGGFDPGAEADRIIRGWRYVSDGDRDGGATDPAALLEAVAGAAERSGGRGTGADGPRAGGARTGDGGPGGGRSGARSKAMAGSRRRARSRARRR